MSINSRIKERRESLNITRNELADQIGVTPSAIANYENEISLPKVEIMYRLFAALKCDANYLYQDELHSDNSTKISTHEFQLIQQYRELDKHGKNLVNFILSEESKRCKIKNDQSKNFD